MTSVFSEQILADMLSKVESTQQCIETTSHWCIFHRNKAQQVVTTWDKQFHNSEMVQKIALLYLANDILQNSKRNGKEFVTEFWKVLPGALKDVIEKNDERGNRAVSKLFDVWEERKVFGSHARSIKELMLGDEVPPPLEFSKKRSRSVKIMRRDSRSIKTKLSIGGTAEKIVSAFHMVLSEHSNEDAGMSKCKSAGQRVRRMEKDVDVACSKAKDPKRKTLSKELEDEENILKQSIEKLKSVEASRLVLVSQLKEALHEQESELENVRNQIQQAEAQAEEARIMRKRLDDEDYVSKPSTASTPPSDANTKSGQTPKKTPAAIAAEVADKLAASSSSQMIMTSVLSSFAAEEAKKAAMAKASTVTSSYPSVPVNPSSNSMLKPENPMAISDPNVFMPAQPHTPQPNNPYQSVLLPQPMIQNQAPTSQPQYHMLPNPQPQQYMQPSGGVMAPYGYGSIPTLPPGPPPPPPHMVSPMVPLTQQPVQIAQQSPPAPPSFRPLQPPGMLYYAHLHHTQ